MVMRLLRTIAVHDELLNHPQRLLPLTSVENARDLGGYPTADGGTTRWGRFVRAADMVAVTSGDQQRLEDYGVHTVIDLRMQHERRELPNRFDSHTRVRVRNHDFWGDRFHSYRSPDRRAAPAQKLAALYCAGLEQNGFVMAEVMRTFAADTDGAFLFHCRSGKDRTGLVAALLLALAGVPDDVICADYAHTAECLTGEAVNPIDASAPGAWQLTCAPETMSQTLAYVRDQYGDVASYLAGQGLTAAELNRVRESLLGS